MSAITEKYHVNVIYAKVYVADQDLPFAVAAVVGHNVTIDTLRARFLARFPDLVAMTPVYILADERDYDDEMEVFTDNAIFV